MTLMKKLRECYEKEALEIKDHQERMYFENPWNTYWHGTRLHEILRMAKSVSLHAFQFFLLKGINQIEFLESTKSADSFLRLVLKRIAFLKHIATKAFIF